MKILQFAFVRFVLLLVKAALVLAQWLTALCLGIVVFRQFFFVMNCMKIKQIATEKGYSLTSTNSGKVLNYTTDDVSLEPKQVTNENGEKVPDPESDSVVANKVKIPYSSYVTTSYEYDATNKVYNRFVNGTSHSDYITKKQYNFKNIIVMNVYNYSMDSYGRQDLNTVGTGTGYYITNGYARPITWSKKTRNSKTTYMYNDGSEIEVNDGNTFIQVQPTSKTTTFE